MVKLDLEATRNVPDSFAGGDLPLDTHPIASTPVVARAVAWKALTVVVGQGCWYGSLLILANFVPPQDFGVIAVGMVLIQLAGLLLDSGTGGALIIARELDVRSLCRTVVRVSAAGLALTMLLVLLAAPIMDRFARGSDPAALRMLAPIIFLLALWIVPNALLKKALCFKRIAIVNVAAVVTASIAAVCAAILGATLWALIIRLVIFQLLLTALTWLAAADIFPRDRQDSPPTPQPGAIAFLAVGAAGTYRLAGGYSCGRSEHKHHTSRSLFDGLFSCLLAADAGLMDDWNRSISRRGNRTQFGNGASPGA